MKTLLAGIATALLAATMLSATDFSSMTMEELVALRGQVPTAEREAFRAEMQSRMQSLTPEERQQYMPTGKTGAQDGTGSRYGSGSGKGSGMGSGSGMGGGMGNGYKGGR